LSWVRLKRNWWRHAQVNGKRAVVVLAREDVPGEKRLVGVCGPRTIRSVRRQLSVVEALRAHLRATLPEYMIPSCRRRVGEACR